MTRSNGKVFMIVLLMSFIAGMILSPNVEACGCCGGGGAKDQGYSTSGNRGAGAGVRPCCQVAYNQGKDSSALNKGQNTTVLSKENEKDAQEKALKSYQDTYGKKDSLTAKATDYGCHVQVDIYEGDKVVKSYTYQQGNVFEM